MRMGKFYASTDMVADKDAHELFGLLKFIPYRVEFLMYITKFEYIGTSPLFREVGDGEKTPEYDIQINYSEGGEVRKVLAQERIA